MYYLGSLFLVYDIHRILLAFEGPELDIHCNLAELALFLDNQNGAQ